jgi:D-amino-acid oxidase
MEYLSWLRSELESRGVVFRRQFVRSLDEVKPFVGKTGLLVNATSLGEHMPAIASYQLSLTVVGSEGSRSLIGVEDTTMYPIRGQSIVVESNGLQEFVTVRSGQSILTVMPSLP